MGVGGPRRQQATDERTYRNRLAIWLGLAVVLGAGVGLVLNAAMGPCEPGRDDWIGVTSVACEVGKHFIPLLGGILVFAAVAVGGILRERGIRRARRLRDQWEGRKDQWERRRSVSREDSAETE